VVPLDKVAACVSFLLAILISIYLYRRGKVRGVEFSFVTNLLRLFVLVLGGDFREDEGTVTLLFRLVRLVVRYWRRWKHLRLRLRRLRE